MPYISIALPAGIRNHGTDLESTGRWIDGSLVRWDAGSLRPVNGWNMRVAADTDNPPRGAVAWVDNSFDRHLAFGTADKLFAVSQSNVVSDITPTGFNAGYGDAQENLAYGGKPFGSGFYGVERPSDGVLLEADTWSLDNWGQNLIGCSTSEIGRAHV